MLLLLPAVLLVSLGCCCCSLLYHGQCCKTELYPTWEYPHLALPAVLLVNLGCCCSLITKLVYLGLGWLSLFNGELFPKKYWRGPQPKEVGEEGG